MATNVTRLKELLFDNEQARLGELGRRLELLAIAEQQSRDAISQRLEQVSQTLARERAEIVAEIDAVSARAGSDEQFQAAMAGLLDGAIRDAEKTNHMALTRAMSPMVLRTITTEFKRKESEILQALMPHTGRLVRDYVRTAMRDLVAEINGKLEAGLKQNTAMLHVRSVMTGRPVAELALAELEQPKVTDLFLIRRGSGELIAHWPNAEELTGDDIHFSGILAQINEFAMRADRADADGAIRTFGSGKSTVYLRASPLTLLVARVSGPELPGSQGIVNDAFFAIGGDDTAMLDAPPLVTTDLAHGSRSAPPVAKAADQTDGGTIVVGRGPAEVAPSVDGPGLDGLASDLDRRLSVKHRELATPAGLGFNPLLALAIIVAVPLAAWLGWSFYADYATAQTQAGAARVIAASSDLKIYRPEIETGPLGRSVRVTALSPSDDARRVLVQRLRVGLPGIEIADEMIVLPQPTTDFEPTIQDVRREIVAVEANVKAAAEQAVIVRAIARGDIRISQVLSDLATASIGGAEPRRIAAVDAGRNNARSALEDIRRIVRDTPTDIGAARAGTTADGSVKAEPDRNGVAITAMYRATERLHRASAELTSAIVGDVPAMVAAPPQSADAAGAAEALAAATERLVAVTLITVQALKTPQPAPVTTIVERRPDPATPRDRLLSWTRANALFFGNATEYRDARDAAAVLTELARLMSASDDLVRIVGYTDERGGLTRNSTIAKDRADKVTADLIARGVSASRLVAVGRPAGVDISPVVGVQSPNRRVEFELGFIGETAVPP